MISTIDTHRGSNEVYNMSIIILTLGNRYVINGEKVCEVIISHPTHEIFIDKQYHIRFYNDYGIVDSKALKECTLFEVLSFIIGKSWADND